MLRLLTLLYASCLLNSGKDQEETLTKVEFISWAFERLKESRTIASWEVISVYERHSFLVIVHKLTINITAAHSYFLIFQHPFYIYIIVLNIYTYFSPGAAGGT